jgi:galactonate dehydratase
MPTITAVSTVELLEHPNLLWVEVETDTGIQGLGETFFMAKSVAAYIHEIAAPYLIGQDALGINQHWRSLYRQWQRRGIGVEARGASAIDIALWDIWGKATGQSITQLLGGAVRAGVPVYNTCAGPDYARSALIPGDPLYGEMIPGGQYEDLWATLNDPVSLAGSLLDQQIHVMKMFPFDAVADETGGEVIGVKGVKQGLRPIEAVRAAYGDEIEIALELRGRWSLPAAKAIARAASDLDLLWIEDPIRNDTIPALQEFAQHSSAPLAVGENLGSRHFYRELLESQAVGLVFTDPCWCGGLTESRRIGEMAAMYMRPFAAHDCTGPVGLAVGTQLAEAAESGFMQEIVRAFYYGWYQDLVEELPPLSEGIISSLPAPGHGIRLSPRDDFIRKTSSVPAKHFSPGIYL